MYRFVFTIVLSGVMGGTSGGPSEPPADQRGQGDMRVTVTLVLLDAPSGVQTATNLDALGTMITETSELIPGSQVYLEAWCQTPGPNGITTAAVDLTYQTVYFDSSTAQVSRAEQWDVFPFEHSVDDVAGLIDDLGGSSWTGLGVAPNWAKIGTVEFDVTSTPPASVMFCSLFAGTFGRFAIYSEGSVDPSEVDYGCYLVEGPTECQGILGDTDADGDVDLRDIASFQSCFGEEGSSGCFCADMNENGTVNSEDTGPFVDALTGPQ